MTPRRSNGWRSWDAVEAVGFDRPAISFGGSTPRRKGKGVSFRTVAVRVDGEGVRSQGRELLAHNPISVLG